MVIYDSQWSNFGKFVKLILKNSKTLALLGKATKAYLLIGLSLSRTVRTEIEIRSSAILCKLSLTDTKSKNSFNRKMFRNGSGGLV